MGRSHAWIARGHERARPRPMNRGTHRNDDRRPSSRWVGHVEHDVSDGERGTLFRVGPLSARTQVACRRHRHHGQRACSSRRESRADPACTGRDHPLPPVLLARLQSDGSRLVDCEKVDPRECSANSHRPPEGRAARPMARHALARHPLGRTRRLQASSQRISRIRSYARASGLASSPRERGSTEPPLRPRRPRSRPRSLNSSSRR